MDGYLSNWFQDANNNGYIDDDNDHYYLYAGMRRGGRNYYALDVTAKDAPELLWTIQGGTGDFVELGQSWSELVHGKMRHPDTGTVTDVLVFSGGYDKAQDTTANGIPTDTGGAIFIVDASTGALIWKAGPADSSLDLPDMLYSIPATPTLVDVDLDGIVDQIYASDLGGQIWRLDFPTHGEIRGGVVASLTDNGNGMFFTSPDVSVICLLYTSPSPRDRG